MAHPKGNPIPEYMPRHLDFTSVYKPSNDTRPKNMQEKVVSKSLTIGNVMGQGNIKKDPIDATSAGFTPPSVRVDIDYDKLTGSKKG